MGMIWIETSGTYRQIGQQYAEQAGDRLHEAMALYAGNLKDELARHMPRIEQLREQAQRHCPELIEETAGMAEAAGVDEMHLTGFRFFNELGRWVPQPEHACSCVFVPCAAEGPLLCRDSDLEPGNKVSTCHTCRPSEGAATMTTHYLGMAALGAGFNAHGLGFVGASVQAPTASRKSGLSPAILSRMVLGQCRTVGEAADLLGRHRFFGRSQVAIIADAHGAAVRVEFIAGRTPVVTLMPAGRPWFACTNFFISPGLATLHETPEQVQNLDSAYARYGRIAHQLGEEIAPRTVAGLQRLLTDIAQPGMCQPETNVLRTAYAQVCELATRTMHLTPGHPAEAAFQRAIL